jgi:hypothetical protein
MTRRRLLFRILLAAALGLFTNILIAESLAYIPYGPSSNMSFGFNIKTGSGEDDYSLSWYGQPGRGSLSVTVIPPVSETPSNAALRARFTEVFRPEDNKAKAENLPWERRLFDTFGSWPIGVSNAEPLRRIHTAGFPFRALTGREWGSGPKVV